MATFFPYTNQSSQKHTNSHTLFINTNKNHKQHKLTVTTQNPNSLPWSPRAATRRCRWRSARLRRRRRRRPRRPAWSAWRRSRSPRSTPTPRSSTPQPSPSRHGVPVLQIPAGEFTNSNYLIIKTKYSKHSRFDSDCYSNRAFVCRMGIKVSQFLIDTSIFQQNILR